MPKMRFTRPIAVVLPYVELVQRYSSRPAPEGIADFSSVFITVKSVVTKIQGKSFSGTQAHPDNRRLRPKVQVKVKPSVLPAETASPISVHQAFWTNVLLTLCFFHLLSSLPAIVAPEKKKSFAGLDVQQRRG
uniref:Uncharacterized protein n=1 Tax=Nelumbo nucifera TaxID=4432 RepID=A0A822YR70_NELNU|nr:TPA_asm: hypothetical protein HUJ06_004691 [Nelumbo nucifera]